MVDVPGTFEEEHTGSDGADDILVDIVNSVIDTHVVHCILEVVQDMVHDGRTRIPVLVHFVHIGLGERHVIVRDVAERLDEPAVFPTAEETGDAVPVVVGLVGEKAVVLHRGETLDQDVPLSDISEVPRACAAALQPVTAVRSFSTIPVVCRDIQEDVGLDTGRRTFVAHLIGVAGRSIDGTPVVGVAVEVGTEGALNKETDIGLGGPVVAVIHGGQGVTIQKSIRITTRNEQGRKCHQGIKYFFHCRNALRLEGQL